MTDEKETQPNESVFVTHLQLNESLNAVQRKLSEQVTAGFDRVFDKIDASQKHTEAKIEAEVTDIHSRIDHEGKIRVSSVEKIRDERRVRMPVLVGLAAVGITVVGALGGWMQSMATDMAKQQAAAKATEPYEKEFRDRVVKLIETEDERNDRQDSYITGHGRDLVALGALLADEVIERQNLELRLEDHTGDGHPGTVNSVIESLKHQYDQRVDELNRRLEISDNRLHEVRESRNTYDDGLRRDEELTELRSLIDRLDERTRP